MKTLLLAVALAGCMQSALAADSASGGMISTASIFPFFSSSAGSVVAGVTLMPLLGSFSATSRCGAPSGLTTTTFAGCSSSCFFLETPTTPTAIVNSG